MSDSETWWFDPACDGAEAFSTSRRVIIQIVTSVSTMFYPERSPYEPNHLEEFCNESSMAPVGPTQRHGPGIRFRMARGAASRTGRGRGAGTNALPFSRPDQPRVD